MCSALAHLTLPIPENQYQRAWLQALSDYKCLCKSANVTCGELRLCESQSLIAPQSRTESGNRQYETNTLDPLMAIMRLKEPGFTLA